MLRDFPDPRRNGHPILAVRFTPIYNGPFHEGIAELTKLLELSPISAEFHAMSLPEWEQYIGSATLVEGRAAYIRSHVLMEGELHKAVKVFKKFMPNRPNKDSYIVWTHLGGEVGKTDSSNSCFSHRDASAVIEVKSLWPASQPRLARENIEWAHHFFEELEPYSSGAYLNYIDPLLKGWKQKYYGENWDKLVDIKQKWDPNGVMNFQQGIGSNFEPDENYPLDLSPLSKTLS